MRVWIVTYKVPDMVCQYLTGQGDWSENVNDAYHFKLKRDAQFSRRHLTIFRSLRQFFHVERLSLMKNWRLL